MAFIEFREGLVGFPSLAACAFTYSVKPPGQGLGLLHFKIGAQSTGVCFFPLEQLVPGPMAAGSFAPLDETARWKVHARLADIGAITDAI
jgi:hypothetical protein